MAARHGEGSSIENAIQSAKAALHAAEWMPITAVRVLIGIFFCISGGTKLLVPAQFTLMEQTLAESHIPFPHANALFVSLVEFVCGGGLALGFLTPLCALVLVVVMIFAGPGRYSIDGLIAPRVGVAGVERGPRAAM